MRGGTKRINRERCASFVSAFSGWLSVRSTTRYVPFRKPSNNTLRGVFIVIDFTVTVALSTEQLGCPLTRWCRFGHHPNERRLKHVFLTLPAFLTPEAKSIENEREEE